MGILDKLLNKKKTHRNNWNNAPYHTPQPIYQNFPFNPSNVDYRQANLDERNYSNYRDELQLPSEIDYQNNLTVQTREPVAQPFYGNPLAVDSNFYGGAYNGQTQNSFYPNGNQPYANPYQSYQPGWQNQGYYPNGSPQQGIQPNPFQANPFVQQPLLPNTMQNKQNSGFNNVLNQFKSQNGSVDINKMMNTAGQVVSAVNQFSGIIKGIGGIFKV